MKEEGLNYSPLLVKFKPGPGRPVVCGRFYLEAIASVGLLRSIGK